MEVTAADERYMRLAIAAAREGIDQGQSPFGACIVRHDAVISCAHNVVWTTTDITAHAEMIAIRRACETLGTIHLPDCSIYSTCEPCPMCFSACHWARISRILYGARIEDAQRIGFSELRITASTMKQLGSSPVEVRGDYLREEAVAMMDAWFRRPDRRAY